MKEMTDRIKVKIFADGADINGMLEMNRTSYIKGFTTNPTLMKKAGVADYATFAAEVCKKIPDKPISFEVFSDDFAQMKKEAIKLAEFGENVYVKIPVVNSKGESSAELIRELSQAHIKINVTCVFTYEQASEVIAAFANGTNNIVSVFAGRIADTGQDAEKLTGKIADACHQKSGVECLWASCREIFNIVQADRCGADIVTVTNSILQKIPLWGKDLTDYSTETVRMMYEDGQSLGFRI